MPTAPTCTRDTRCKYPLASTMKDSTTAGTGISSVTLLHCTSFAISPAAAAYGLSEVRGYIHELEFVDSSSLHLSTDGHYRFQPAALIQNPTGTGTCSNTKPSTRANTM